MIERFKGSAAGLGTVLLVESIIGRFFFIGVVAISAFLYGELFTASLLQVNALAIILMQIVAFGKTGYYQTRLLIDVKEGQRRSLAERLAGIVVVQGVLCIASVGVMRELLRAEILQLYTDENLSATVLVSVVACTALSKCLSDRGLYLAYGYEASYLRTDVYLKAAVLIVLAAGVDERTALIVFGCYPVGHLAGLVVVRLSGCVKVGSQRMGGLIRLVQTEVKEMISSWRIGLSDLLVMAYTILPLAAGPLVLGKNEMVLLTILLKASETLQMILAPFARAQAIRDIGRNQIGVVALAPLSEARRLVSQKLCRGLNSVRSMVGVWLCKPRSWGLMLVACGCVVMIWQVGVDKMVLIQVGRGVLDHIEIVGLVVVLGCMAAGTIAVFVSTYLDILFKSYATFRGFAYFGPYLVGGITMLTGLVIARRVETAIFVFATHIFAEVGVSASMYWRQKLMEI